MKEKKNYLKNKDLLAEVTKCKQSGEMSDTLIQMFYTLINRYARSANFAGYSYIEDMKADAMFNLVKNWHKFDETKYTNAFAYYTQNIKNSFYQHLNMEKKHRDIRDQELVYAGLDPSFRYQEEHS